MKIEMYEKEPAQDAYNFVGNYIANSYYTYDSRTSETAELRYDYTSTGYNTKRFVVNDEPSTYQLTFNPITDSSKYVVPVLLTDSSYKVLRVVNCTVSGAQTITLSWNYARGITQILVNTKSGINATTLSRIYDTYHIPDTPVRTVDSVINAQISDTLTNDLTLNATLHGADAAAVNDDTLLKWDKYWFLTTKYAKYLQGGTLFCKVTAENILNYLANTSIWCHGRVIGADLLTDLMKRISPQYVVTIEDAVNKSPYCTYDKPISGKQLIEDYCAYSGAEIVFDGFNVRFVKHRGSSTPYDLIKRNYVQSVKYSREINSNKTSYQVSVVRLVGTYGWVIGSYVLGSAQASTRIGVGDEINLKVTGLCDVQTRVVGITFNPYDLDREASIEVGSIVGTVEDTIVNSNRSANGGMYADEE